MADRELSNALSSGEIASINLGGITTADAVQKKEDMTSINISFDNTLTSLVATTVKAALEELANVGYSHMKLLTAYTAGQTLGLTAVKLSAFDTIAHDVNGAVTPTVDASEASATHKFTIDKAGAYRVYGTVLAEFASADAVSMLLYKNGTPLGPPVSIQGRGAGKPVLFSYIDIVDLSVTDYLEVWAYSDAASTSTLITGSSMVVERMPI